MTISWAGLLPHPPIIVPAVGGVRRSQAQQTIDACEALAEDFVANQATRLIVISPHTSRPASGIATWTSLGMQGDFAAFGAPNQRLEIANDLAWLTRFQSVYPHLHELGNQGLDHGATVPLFFLKEAGWQGPTCVLSLPWADAAELRSLGQALKGASQEGRTAILASGDMSHCLRHDGPYGFHPQGPVFDRLFVEAIRHKTYAAAENIASATRQSAKEDVLDASIVAWAAIDYATHGAEFFSYEGPFGVGYAVMKYFGRLP